MLYGQQKIDGNWYLFDNYDGAMQFGYQWIPELNKEVYYDPKTGAMVYGAQVINGERQYFDPVTGAQVKNGYATFDGQTSYYDADGNMVYGQQKINGHWQYFDPTTGAQAKNQYITIAGLNKTCYYDADGNMVYGQQKINGHWQYFDPTTGAQAKNQFVYLQGLNRTVYYDADGNMVYGAQTINGKKYYFDPVDGAMWQDKLEKKDNHLIYYGDDGAQVIKQTYKVGNGTYTFDQNGYVEGSGQVGVGNQWYLLKDGIVQTGYQWLSGLNKEVYYDPQTGEMVHGQRQIDGHWQYFDPTTGAQANNQYVWMPDLNKEVYYDANGNMVYGQQKINGHWQYFDPTTGAQAKNKFIHLSDLNKTVYYDQNGNMVYGVAQISGNAYYFDTVTGAEVFNQTINLGYGTAYFGGDGAMQNITLNFTYYSQLNQGAPEGCEGTAFQMAESVRGWHHSLQQIYDATGYGWDKDCYNGFYGNPWGGGVWKTQTVTSDRMAATLGSMDPGIHTMNGASIQDVISQLQMGHAVVTWVNYDWNASPSDQGDYHIMTIVGYNNGQFLVADPYSYSRRVYWVNQDTWHYVNENEHANGWNLPTGMNLTV